MIKVNREERLVAIKLTTLPPGVEPTVNAVAPPAAVEDPVTAAPAAETETEEAAPPADA